MTLGKTALVAMAPAAFAEASKAEMKKNGMGAKADAPAGTRAVIQADTQADTLVITQADGPAKVSVLQEVLRVDKVDTRRRRLLGCQEG